jgi:glycosyltransferase involved in cell wall biosynthesis
LVLRYGAAVRVRFFSYFYPPCVGGGEVILQHQAEELARRGHEVHVHTTPFTNLNLATRIATGDTVENGVHVHRRESHVLPVRNPLEANALTPAFVTDAWRAADLLVCVGYPSAHLDALSARARATKTPLVVQNYVTAEFLREILSGEGGLHKRVRAAYWRGWVRKQLAGAALVLADSPGAARALRQELGLHNVRTHIGMAVDPAEFDAVTVEQRSSVRARLGLGEDRVILAPSRFSAQKGADLLVAAVKRALDIAPRALDGWRVVIPGAVNEPRFAAEVRAQGRTLGERVIFAPDAGLPRDQLVALFCESDVVVLPSRGETVGGVVFEGMYAGALALVSDAVEAAREDYLIDGQNGLIFRANDVEALAEALLRSVTQDLSALRRAGRQMVASRFTWAASVDRLETLQREACTRARGGST